MCIKLSHFAVQQRLTQHCKSTLLQLKKKTKRTPELTYGVKERRNAAKAGTSKYRKKAVLCTWLSLKAKVSSKLTHQGL